MTMTLTDEMLLRYADGTLSSAEARAVEELLEGDEVAKERLRLVQASGIALRGARDHDLTGAPIDRALALVRKGAVPRQGRAAAPRRTGFADRARPWRTAAGVALFAGGLALGMTFPPQDRGASPPPVTQAKTAGGWVDAVVEYQSLYSRATFETVRAYPDRIPELQTRLADALGARISIPDLADLALDFRQGRQLEFRGKAIVQLVYLPLKEGKPVSLCAIKKVIADFQPRYFVQQGIGVVQWAQAGVEFLLVGEHPRSTLETAAQKAMTRL